MDFILKNLYEAFFILLRKKTHKLKTNAPFSPLLESLLKRWFSYPVLV